MRLRKALMDQRTAWHQRIHAVLYHHGLPERSWLLADQGRAWLTRLELPTVARQTVDLALRTIDFLDTELDQLDATLGHIARGQPGCQALMGRYRIGWPGRGEHLGRVRRRAPVRQLPPSRPVHRAGHHRCRLRHQRARGHLARQGPPVLRWALHEAAMGAARPGSPDHAYYLQVRTRLGGKRAALSVARKLAREAYHTLGTLGDQALAPVVLRPAA